MREGFTVTFIGYVLPEGYTVVVDPRIVSEKDLPHDNTSQSSQK